MVEFLSFIISSIGALQNKSINNFTRMIGTATKNTVGLCCKKLVVKALKGSFMIWVKAKPETLVSNNRKKQEKQFRRRKTHRRKKLLKQLMKNSNSDQFMKTNEMQKERI
jgi:hypothetical protein